MAVARHHKQRGRCDNYTYSTRKAMLTCRYVQTARRNNLFARTTVSNTTTIFRWFAVPPCPSCCFVEALNQPLRSAEVLLQPRLGKLRRLRQPEVLSPLHLRMGKTRVNNDGRSKNIKKHFQHPLRHRQSASVNGVLRHIDTLD